MLFTITLQLFAAAFGLQGKENGPKKIKKF